jgi:hypothetical protein
MQGLWTWPCAQVTIQNQRATTAGSSFSIFVRPQYFWSDTGKQDYSLVVTGKFTVGECEADTYKLLCPNDCSGLGECFDNGECVCDVGYSGDDCSHYLPRLYRDVDVEFAVTSESWAYMVIKHCPSSLPPSPSTYLPPSLPLSP